MVLDSFLTSMKVDGANHVLVTGTFAGSMTIDDNFLATPDPLAINQRATYLASFRLPSADSTAPTIGNLPGTIDLNPPGEVYVQATSAQGAIVWYMPPTAKDDKTSGVNITCSPKANTQFPLGVTPVNC